MKKVAFVYEGVVAQVNGGGGRGIRGDPHTIEPSAFIEIIYPAPQIPMVL